MPTHTEVIILEGYAVAARLRWYANEQRATRPKLAESLDHCVEKIRKVSFEMEREHRAEPSDG